MITVTTTTYWASHADAFLAGKEEKVREHPMPGYSPAAPTPPPPTKWQKTPHGYAAKRETYTPERVLRQLVWETIHENYVIFPNDYPEKRSTEIIERLKRHGFEITPITKPDG